MKTTTTRTTSLFVLVLVALLTPPAVHADEAKQAAAVKAAEVWLALIDNAEYDKSWDEAAPAFQRAVPRSQWVQQIRSVRGPLGALKSRNLLGAKYTTEIPNAAKGEYVIMQFQTSFGNKDNAVETVTPMLDDKGAWRVSGYYIR
jgi:hypothetical protein